MENCSAEFISDNIWKTFLNIKYASFPKKGKNDVYSILFVLPFSYVDIEKHTIVTFIFNAKTIC